MHGFKVLPIDEGRSSSGYIDLDGEYTRQSKLLQDFLKIPSIDKLWILNSDSVPQAMFSVSQPDILRNRKRNSIFSSYILKDSQDSVKFQWPAFPVEMEDVLTMVPSPSGKKLLKVRKCGNESFTLIEIWNSCQLEKEFLIPASVHGQVYIDGWFEGISWNLEETYVAYIAEQPAPSKPVFNAEGYKKGDSADKDEGCWKGQGEWQEDWGETYAGKQQPALFVIEINSGVVCAVKGIEKSLSVGQVVWAPGSVHLVFVGWPSSEGRKLGIKYCRNRPCSLYVVKAPIMTTKFGAVLDKVTWNVDRCGTRNGYVVRHILRNVVRDGKPFSSDTRDDKPDDEHVVILTPNMCSAFFPRFSPDGKFLVFLSCDLAVKSGVHRATDTLHRIEWPCDYRLSPLETVNVVPDTMSDEDGKFPGFYCESILSKPFLSDGCTMILSSIWCSFLSIIKVNIVSGKLLSVGVGRWGDSCNILAVHGNDLIAECSSPVNIPEIMYGSQYLTKEKCLSWRWSHIPNPIFKSSEKVASLLSSLEFRVMDFPVHKYPEYLTEGSKNSFEAIFVSSKKDRDMYQKIDPMIVVLHGGPHSASLTTFSKSLAFLSSLRFSLLIINYRGSLGFGEHSLQSLPGKIGTQDVGDVINFVNHIVDLGLADPSNISLLGGSHGGFLATHLIGQMPGNFVAAAVRNPVCNLAMMTGVTDIPDWCYVEACGAKDGKSLFHEEPVSGQLLPFLYNKSPISHISKVKTPTLFLLGAQDLRVPCSNGLQYARALKEKGVPVKVMMFPHDTHSLDRVQTDFESFLNIGIWFTKYCKK